MFGLSRTRTVRDLQERLAAVTEQRDAARADAATWKNSSVRTAARFSELHTRAEKATAAHRVEGEHTGSLERRLRRLLIACARYRIELRRTQADFAFLQSRYDDALGLTSPAVEMGEHWQTRRSDKTVPEVSS
ncbi:MULTISPECIES: hypothetical protein [Streptomyces]|uniref:Uncharacterized protein n=1 Tax=Streptomyces evansiae TaxID=3075535 RepID=A0ABU2R3Q3_9ACTN|nr:MULTISPECIES: hypothetical protein [unclassified Streptomyces]MDT0409905.1 hypothetical protein [Streptomyces sp. DSM 41979]MYQ60006.1 hypothetical protein [Streptomyces sp. SID4926]SCE40185.1 hypothetical protein GA0115252_146415 [Streptomyces sp. DfronAA-171]